MADDRRAAQIDVVEVLIRPYIDDEAHRHGFAAELVDAVTAASITPGDPAAPIIAALDAAWAVHQARNPQLTDAEVEDIKRRFRETAHLPEPHWLVVTDKRKHLADYLEATGPQPAGDALTLAQVMDGAHDG